jgi:hypothetical protein
MNTFQKVVLYVQGRTQDFSPGGGGAVRPIKVPNTQRIIIDIIKIVNIVFLGPIYVLHFKD